MTAAAAQQKMVVVVAVIVLAAEGASKRSAMYVPSKIPAHMAKLARN
jgi:hypothetical protein